MLVLRACFSLIVSGAGGRYPSELCGQIVLYSCRVWGSEVRVPHRPPNVNCTREALSITWEQVDSDNRTVTVGESKTDAGTGRNIPLDQTLLGRLTALSAKHYQLQMLYRDWNPTGFVFCTSAGKRGDKDKSTSISRTKALFLPNSTYVVGHKAMICSGLPKGSPQSGTVVPAPCSIRRSSAGCSGVSRSRQAYSCAETRVK